MKYTKWWRINSCLLIFVVLSSNYSDSIFCNAFSAQTPLQTQSSPIGSIKQSQADAESKARSIHDNYSMNALFVNVEEKKQPTPFFLHGELPKDLPPGCLLRIGPNGASTEEGFLDGDGMVHCITLPPSSSFSHDSMMYTATYVQTKGRKLERARRIRIRNDDAEIKKFEGTLGAAPEGLPMLASLFRNGLNFKTLDVQKDTCNTALAISGDRILALMEQSPPSEITIDKSGRMKTVQSFQRLNGAVTNAPVNGGSLGAHGRTDPDTKQRVHASYNSVLRPYVRVDTFDENWSLKESVGVDIPSPIMVHDSVITNDYTVILDFPLTIKPSRMFTSNLFPVNYEPENGTRIGLVPRNGYNKGKNTMWFDVEPGVVLHAANAYQREEDGFVVVHGFKSIPSGSNYILEYTPAFLYEWVLDPCSGETVSEGCLNSDIMLEFPQIEERLNGKKSDCVYGLVTTSIGGPMLQFKTPQSAVLLDSVAKLALHDDLVKDIKAGDVMSRYDLPKNWHFVSEPTVVTKTGENGAYILLIATYVPPPSSGSQQKNHVKVATSKEGGMKSQFLILDGDNLEVVTTIDLPHHVNYGLHSLFVEWDKIK